MRRTPHARVRRSVALPRELVNEAVRPAPRELRENLNRLVIVSLEEFVARRKASVLDKAMAEVATDPAIRAECARIDAEFMSAALDGLPQDSSRFLDAHLAPLKPAGSLPPKRMTEVDDALRLVLAL